MQRTIKFRGKRIEDGKWIYGYLAEDDYINNIDEIDMPSEEVDPDTVGQFTGLKDRNGKEIYEGDILVCGQCVALVLWNKELATFALQFNFEKQVCTKPLGEWQTVIIVGNINDNPELLKGGNK